MHTLHESDTISSTLRQLDNVLHSLWAHEPDSRFGERHHLLNLLRQLSLDVERLTFRRLFDRSSSTEQAEIDSCVARTAQLAANWSDDVWAATPWPSDLLGERSFRTAA